MTENEKVRNSLVAKFNGLKKEWDEWRERFNAMIDNQDRSSKVKPLMEQIDEREPVLMDLLLKIAPLYETEKQKKDHQETVDEFTKVFESHAARRKASFEQLLQRESDEKGQAQNTNVPTCISTESYVVPSTTQGSALGFNPQVSLENLGAYGGSDVFASFEDKDKEEDNLSVLSASSAREKQERANNDLIERELAKFKAELDLAKSNFIIEKDRLQRENRQKDEAIQKLSEELENVKLTSSNIHTGSGRYSADRFSRTQSTPLRNVSFSVSNSLSRTHLDNWLDTTSRNDRQTPFETRTSTVIDRAVPSASTERFTAPLATSIGSTGNLIRPGSGFGSSLLQNQSHATAPSTSFDRSLPKLKLTTYSGDPLEWPEWSGLFQATIGKCNISSDEKMSHLKTLLDGPAKRALSGMGYSGELYDTAWKTLERKLGQPRVIVSSQLSKLNNFFPMKFNDSAALILFADIVSNFVNVLQQFGYSNDLFSSSNLEMAVNKLSLDIKRRWYAHIESSSKRRQIPNLMIFNEWLQEEALVHERLIANSKHRQYNSGRKGDTTKQNYQHQKRPEQNFTASDGKKPDTSDKCPVDSESHKLWQCDKFKRMKVSDRYDVVKKNKLCFSCLSNKHQIKDCNAKECGINGCSKHHNKLLHFEIEKSRPEVTPMTLANNSTVATKGLLQVCNVRIQVPEGRAIDTKAILDTGSSHTWIDKAFADKLGLTGKSKSILVAGIHGTSAIDCNVVAMSVGSIWDPKIQINIRANTHQNMDVGNSKYDLKTLKSRFPNLRCISGVIVDLSDCKVILGQDCFPIIRPLEYRKLDSGSPWAVKTPLGWTLSGPLPESEQESCVNATVMMSNDDLELGEQVRRWWEVESYGTKVSVDPRSADDKKSCVILENSVQQKGNRYEVSMLWNSSAPQLPNNYISALSQLRSLESRLSKDPVLAEQYAKTIEKDLNNGYIKRVSPAELTATKHLKQWYLPHHPVCHPHKPGKVRRVCNAASKFRGISLNDCLMIGPDLLNNLFGVLFRFREHSIAFCADIEAMFMQVLVPEEDQRCLRFLWRYDKGDIAVYQYTRHIFGAKSSPTCVIFALRKCALDNAKDFPAAAETVLKNFYVDDSPKSVANKDAAKQLCEDLLSLLTRGGFQLGKWVCNVPGVVPTTETDSAEISMESTTVLGMKWDPKADILEVCRGTKREAKQNWTQREILSIVSSVFDPIGILSPFVITARIIMKNIWETQGQQWDNFVDEEINERFKKWFSELKSISSVQIPRCYHLSETLIISRQLHIFCDASQEAFSAVAYMRNELSNGDVSLTYIVGKCRVAPKKFQTIPKLELMAAVVAARLKDIILKEHTIQFTSIVFWSDSTTVLKWICSHYKKHPVFIANRLTEIMDVSTVDQWRHVPGTMNPADLGSRGTYSVESLQGTWLTGPAWLKDKDLWPEKSNFTEEQDETALSSTTKCSVIEWKDFSNFKRLRNTIARILHLRSGTTSTFPSIDSLRKTENAIWRLIQRESFSDEIAALHKGVDLPSCSKVIKFSPFLDADGIMRAKGRLRKSNLDFDAKHPILLPSSHHAIKLFLEMNHREYFHEGVEYLRSIIQQKYWILGLRNALRSVKHQCFECKRAKAATFEPEMADLPIERVDNKVRPFQHTGVDYFGPFEVTLLRRTLKRWVCLFTCLATRAVHMEIVGSLDTQSCLTAITRFICRRGKPDSFISDNGTNFVGAAKEFRQMFQENMRNGLISEKLAMKNIRWSFNPPAAPHFGGSWERLVKSCKKSMYYVLGRQKLTDDVLQTTICIVEQLLNDRPLVPNSSDIEDLEPITPNHFLLGHKSINFPLALATQNIATSLRKAYKMSEFYSQFIWERWMREYLTQLNQRNKWYKYSRNPCIGDMVWVLDHSVRRGFYPLAKIVEVHYGDDGTCRSAKIKTATGYLTRPMVKLAPLQVDGVFPLENRAGDVGASSKF